MTGLGLGASPRFAGVATLRSSLMLGPAKGGSGPKGPLLHIARPRGRREAAALVCLQSLPSFLGLKILFFDFFVALRGCRWGLWAGFGHSLGYLVFRL